MKSWNATTAKRHFSQIIEESRSAPQVVEKRGEPVSVILSMKDFRELEERRRLKSLDQWMDELKAINLEEGDLEATVRLDRDTPDWDEL